MVQDFVFISGESMAGLLKRQMPNGALFGTFIDFLSSIRTLVCINVMYRYVYGQILLTFMGFLAFTSIRAI